MSISCPSLPLSLFEDISNINEKYEESIKKVQSEIMTISSKLKENSKEIDVIHKLFISLNERINHTVRKDFIIDSNCLEAKIDKIIFKIDEIENNLKMEISRTKQENREYIDLKMEEIHSRLLKNLGFLFEQQFKALKNEILRPNPPISPMILPVVNKEVVIEEPWTKVDKKNYKPK
jgi:hypothetical protein